MATSRLTKEQKVRLAELQRYSRLYVGYNCPTIMRSFDKLVEKGLAEVAEETETGKKFQITEGE